MITSKTNPKIKNIIKLEKASERREQNRILIEGRREIERAVACGFEVDTLFMCPDLTKDGAGITARSVEEVSLEVFEKIAYREGSDGLLAVAIPRYADLKAFKPKKKNPLIIVLETVEKPGNLGAVMRTADAALAARDGDDARDLRGRVQICGKNKISRPAAAALAAGRTVVCARFCHSLFSSLVSIVRIVYHIRGTPVLSSSARRADRAVVRAVSRGVPPRGCVARPDRRRGNRAAVPSS